MATTLYLIRHGETIDSDERRYKGRMDVPLSEKGMEQMRHVARFISQDYPARFGISVYTSDLIRAVRSAEIIADAFGLKPVIVPELRERDFGEWEGMRFDDIEKRWRGAFRAWADNPLRFAPPGGETTLEVRDRVVRSIRMIMDSAGDVTGGIIIIAHGGVNRIILCHMLGMPLKNIFRIEQDYGCINIIEIHDGYPIIRLLNYRAG